MELYTAQNYLPCYNECYFNNLEKQTEENLIIFFFFKATLKMAREAVDVHKCYNFLLDT